MSGNHSSGRGGGGAKKEERKEQADEGETRHRWFPEARRGELT